MRYIFDTDILIYFLKGHIGIIERLSSLAPRDICTTIITHAELLYGTFNSIKKKDNLEKITAFLSNLQILPFCEEASYIFAEYKSLLKNRGNIIADLDLMIASITLRNKSVLVTNNVKHFSRLKGLKIENWAV